MLRRSNFFGSLEGCRGCTSDMRMQAVETPVEVVAEAAPVHLPTNEESETLLRIRHTSAHVMAMAVQKLFKDAKVTIGPWIDKGFYYDFDRETQFKETECAHAAPPRVCI